MPRVAYAADEHVKINIDVDQSFTASATDLQIDQEIKYLLKTENSDAPLPTSEAKGEYSFTIKGTDKTVLSMEYSHAGEYIYTLKQNMTEAKKGYTYDKEVYTLKVYILNTASGLQPEVICQRSDNNKVAVAAFANSYRPEGTDSKLMTDPPVVKVVSGTPKADSDFSFKLTAKDSKNPMPSGSINGAKTVTIKGAGRTEFGVWEYKEAGVYKYEVTEVNGGIKGYTYDTAVYSITDTVKDVNGKLVLERKVTDAKGKDAVECKFTNVYKATATTGTAPTGTGSTGTSGTGTSSTDKTSTSKGPKTGDEYNNTLYIVLLCVAVVIAAAAAAWIILVKKRRLKDEK